MVVVAECNPDSDAGTNGDRKKGPEFPYEHCQANAGTGRKSNPAMQKQIQKLANDQQVWQKSETSLQNNPEAQKTGNGIQQIVEEAEAIARQLETISSTGSPEPPGANYLSFWLPEIKQ